jgi:hypothetical protein
VVNDLITDYYPDIPLPGQPVTGQTLIGCTTLGMTVEQVLARLRETFTPRLPTLTTLDHHRVWEPEANAIATEQHGSAELRKQVNDLVEQCARGDRWGTAALAVARPVPERHMRYAPARLLQQKLGRRLKPEAIWVPPSRHLAAFYPKVILPHCRYGERRRVLLALDASGSTPDEWLGVFALSGDRNLCPLPRVLPGCRGRAHRLRSPTTSRSDASSSDDHAGCAGSSPVLCRQPASC